MLLSFVLFVPFIETGNIILSYWPPSPHYSLILSLPDNIEGFDPRQVNDFDSSLFSTRIVSRPIFGYLGLIKPNTSEVFPGIAQDWTRNANGSYTFHLQPNAVFHDGSPVTAQDVEYSWKLGLVLRGLIDNVNDPSSDDYYQFTYSEPGAQKFTVSSSVFTLDPYNFPLAFSGRDPYLTLFPYGTDKESVMMTPISCGPYMLYEFQKDDYALLERFDYWFGWGMTLTGSNGQSYTLPTKEQAFKYLKYRFIPEEAMALVELRTGGIDIFFLEEQYGMDLDSNLLYTMKVTGFDGMEVPLYKETFLAFNMLGTQPLTFNGTGNYPLTETWFRQAISYAINYSGIQTNSSLDLNNFTTQFSFWDSFVNQNLSKASEILEEHGYTPLGFTEEPENRFGHGEFLNETLNQTKGHHFTISIFTEEENKLALLLSQNLREIGVFLDIIPQESTDFRFCTSGSSYNESFTNEPDPDYSAPVSDFCFVSRYYSSNYTADYLNDFYWNNWWLSGRWDLNGGWYSDVYETNVGILNELVWHVDDTFYNSLTTSL
ncbi:MAG: ABC transporter substrate-binding protein, partial [Candidatus Hodarchaeales archaeon]